MLTRNSGPERDHTPLTLGCSVASCRHGCSAALFLVEAVGLTLRFDGKTIQDVRGGSVSGATRAARTAAVETEQDSALDGISWLFQQSNLALGMGVAIASFTLIVASRRVRDALDRRVGPWLWRWSWPAFISHFASLAIFTGLTQQIFEGVGLSSGLAPFWIFGWVLSGLAVLVLLVATPLSPRLLAASCTIRIQCGGFGFDRWGRRNRDRPAHPNALAATRTFYARKRARPARIGDARPGLRARSVHGRNQVVSG